MIIITNMISKLSFPSFVPLMMMMMMMMMMDEDEVHCIVDTDMIDNHI